MQNSDSKLGKLHGTTTVGLVCTDGIVLGTDTRAVLGTYFIAHQHVRKIATIDDHLAMTIAGGVADAQGVIDAIKYNASIYKLERKQPLPVKSAARLASNIFFSARLYPLIADVLVGGFDEEGADLYNVDLFGSLTQEKFISTGSGSPVAYGILESEFSENLTMKEAVPIAVKAVHAAIKRNAGTGDGIDVVTINGSGLREIGAAEKQKIVAGFSGGS
ncbi:MAG: proteasome subunit beta [Thaumarchaeota archaeon]|nr:proteasome subunit beta [Nitrososphaerota archaeon]